MHISALLLKTCIIVTKGVIFAAVLPMPGIQAHNQPTLREFLEEVALVADIDNVENDSNKVLLMTLHSAKGLEFPHVYLARFFKGHNFAD